MPETQQQIETTTSLSDTKIIFFDGVCGLCNRFVDFVLRHDQRGSIKFAPLQGDTAHQILPNSLTENLNSVAYSADGKTWTHSSAVVRILWELGLFWKVCAALMWIIPKPLRNIGYRTVAKLRYRLFGKTETCRMPQPGEQERFLD